MTKQGTKSRILLAGRQVEFRLVSSKAAAKLRIRVGISGVEVIRPETRDHKEVNDFLLTNSVWIVNQLERVERFQGIRKPHQSAAGSILFRGEQTAVRIDEPLDWHGPNRIVHEPGQLVILRSAASVTEPAKSLENWLRKQARNEISKHLNALVTKLNRQPGKLLIMGQRTKWGNCSPLQNLSFNWRVILAPEFVLRYLVTHEAVHLAVPDHSQKFWLTVRSLCPETERAKQWLCANAHRLLVPLNEVCTA
jgi:predicted metal-dependent hydrolase